MNILSWQNSNTKGGSLINEIYLLDGTSFVYRAFFAIGHLRNSKGHPTNAIYGFLRMLNKILEQYNPEYVAIGFDKGKETFRHKGFKDYKANRKPMPDDLLVQIPVIKKIINAYNIPLLEMDEFEADDIIASLATKAVREGFRVYIITSDKDMLQLVDDDILVLNPAQKDVLYTPEAVEKRFGVPPHLILDLLAMAGDPADNIPGIPGVGMKTAARLLQRFHSLEELLDRIGEMENSRLKDLIVKNEPVLRNNIELIRIRKDIDLKISLAECKRKNPDLHTLKAIFRELEFKNMLKEILDKEDKASAIEIKEQTVRIDSKEQWSRLKSDIFDCKDITLLFRREGKKVGIGLMRRYVVVPYQLCGDDIPHILGDESISICTYDSKELYKITDPKCKIFDILIAGYLLDPSQGNYSIEQLAFRYLGKIKDTGEDPVIQDLRFIEGLKEIFERRIIKEGLFELYNRIESPLVRVLAHMEKNGIKIDMEKLTELDRYITYELEGLKEYIFKLAGGSFNISSPRQLEQVLFGKLKLPVLKRTKTGYSTDESVLLKLKRYSELPGKILEYRKLMKLKNTYIDPIPSLINSSDGRLHTTFNQAVSSTGRLTSSNPNLQNIPVKSEIGKQLRKIFVPEDGYMFVAGDYSQMELRLLAHMSADKALISAFHKDKDIHTLTASEIFGVLPELVTPDMRRDAKMVNFGIIYGMADKGLSEALGIGLKEARDYIDRYLSRYPGVSRFIEDLLKRAEVDGYVTTLFGRRRYIPELKSKNPSIVSSGKRIAINTPIQGSAADIIKLAMIRIYRDIENEIPDIRMLLQIHDELIFEVRQELVEDFIGLLKTDMEGIVDLQVPLKVDIKVGRTWAEL